MRIRYFPDATSTPLILGDDSVGDYIKGYAGSLPSDVLPVRFYKVPYPLLLPNGFQAGQRSWTVDRQHATAAVAFLFSEQHPSAVFAAGILEITDSGTIYLDAVRADAKLIERNGLTTIFNYTFSVGLPRTSKV